MHGNRQATFFAFRSAPLNVAERQTQADALARIYAGQGWTVPRLVAATLANA
jgi:hypothetical protein